MVEEDGNQDLTYAETQRYNLWKSNAIRPSSSDRTNIVRGLHMGGGRPLRTPPKDFTMSMLRSPRKQKYPTTPFVARKQQTTLYIKDRRRTTTEDDQLR
jgi:hypothetical protein